MSSVRRRASGRPTERPPPTSGRLRTGSEPELTIVVPAEYVEGDVLRGRYQLVHPLSEGGMGLVWLAQHTRLRVELAIKLVRGGSADPSARARLEREANVAARLVHPNIVRILDYDITEYTDPFLVMERLHGESLRQRLEREKRLAALEAVRIFLPLLAALEYAHKEGAIHRDIKPENIFLADHSQQGLIPKLLDFGIVKDITLSNPEKLTRAGIVMGSPEYMAPEQAKGRTDVDARSDIWASGVVLYELLTGRRPFAGDNDFALLASIIDDAPVPIVRLAAGDSQLWSILARALHKDRGSRYQHAWDFGVALARWAASRGANSDISGRTLAAYWLGAEGAEANLHSMARDSASTLASSGVLPSVRRDLPAVRSGGPHPSEVGWPATKATKKRRRLRLRPKDRLPAFVAPGRPSVRGAPGLYKSWHRS